MGFSDAVLEGAACQHKYSVAAEDTDSAAHDEGSDTVIVDCKVEEGVVYAFSVAATLPEVTSLQSLDALTNTCEEEYTRARLLLDVTVTSAVKELVTDGNINATLPSVDWGSGASVAER